MKKLSLVLLLLTSNAFAGAVFTVCGSEQAVPSAARLTLDSELYILADEENIYKMPGAEVEIHYLENGYVKACVEVIQR